MGMIMAVVMIVVMMVVMIVIVRVMFMIVIMIVPLIVTLLLITLLLIVTLLLMTLLLMTLLLIAVAFSSEDRYGKQQSACYSANERKLAKHWVVLHFADPLDRPCRFLTVPLMTVESSSIDSSGADARPLHAVRHTLPDTHHAHIPRHLLGRRASS
jgi:hypothetical protein